MTYKKIFPQKQNRDSITSANLVLIPTILSTSARGRYYIVDE